MAALAKKISGKAICQKFDCVALLAMYVIKVVVVTKFKRSLKKPVNAIKVFNLKLLKCLLLYRLPSKALPLD